MVLYEYHTWLERQSVLETFKKSTVPDITLFGPAIFFTDNKTVEYEGNPYEAIQELTAPIINLKLIPIKYFSFINSTTE